MKTPFVLLLLAGAVSTHAQPAVCSSDAQPQAVALLERYTSADCAACWQAADTPVPRPGQWAIDWIVPGAQGDDAPLSAVATRDALARLDATGQPVPTRHSHTFTAVRPGPTRAALRVAHGLPFNGYLGTRIAYQPARNQLPTGPLTAWLLLVEAIPTGTEGTPVPRLLVRQRFTAEWPLATQPVSKEWQASPVMAIPEGADPSRLRVLGWVQDTAGQVLAAAQSRCRP